MKSSSLHHSRTALALFTAGALTGSVFAGTSAKEKLSKSVIEPEPPSKIHTLINVDISDHYITPRGLNVENEGVVVQPLVLIF